jgi:Ca-activated chloride channel family protein
MNFIYSQFLIFLFILPFLFFIGWKGIIEHKKRILRFIKTPALKKMGIKVNFKEKKLSLYLWMIIFFLIIISLSRPVGGDTEVTFKSEGKDIVVLLDISESMKVNDVNIPVGNYSDYIDTGERYGLTRFTAARKIIYDLTDYLKGERISLVAFSDESFPLSPLTNDYKMFKSFLESLDFSYSNGGSTDIKQALITAEKRFYNIEKKSGKIVFLFSDGENQNSENIINTAEELKKSNIIINTISLGMTQGSKIPESGKDIFGKQRYKTYLGSEVISKPDEELMKQLAQSSGGKYFKVEKENIAKLLFEEIKKTKSDTNYLEKSTKKTEIFQIFLLIALIFYIFDLFLPFLTYFKK